MATIINFRLLTTVFMHITVNGKTRDMQSPLSIKELIAELCKDPTVIIAELNGIIIKTDQWTKEILKEGDRIELFSFVGGG